MKILFIAPANSIHTVRWVNSLAECGEEIFLLSLKSHKESVNQISGLVKCNYLSICGNVGYYLNAAEVKKIYNDIKPDVVNVHYASGYGTLARVAKIPNILLSVWGSDVYDFPYESLLKMQIIRRNISWAFQLASTSNVMAAQVEKIMKKKIDIQVTPFGVDCKKFSPGNTEGRETFNFCVIKMLTHKYGIDTIMEAFSIFYKTLMKSNKIEKKIYLNIFGQGNDLNALMALRDKLDMQNNIKFGGYIKHDMVPEVLRETDVFCCGSRYNSESFGVSAVEAMACGVPVIVTDVDGFREVVKDKQTGYIVPKDSPANMAESMLNLYLDDGLRKSMGMNGRKRVEKFYDWEKNVELMRTVYKDIAKYR